MVNEAFVDERLSSAALVVQRFEGLYVPEEYQSQVGDLAVAALVAAGKREIEAVAVICQALFRLGYEAGKVIRL